MKRTVLITCCLLLLLPVWAGQGAADMLPSRPILVAAKDRSEGRKPGPSTVIIKGKGGKITDVEQRPDKDRREERDRKERRERTD